MNSVNLARPVRVGICGLGTVATGAINIINRNKSHIDARSGCDISIVQVGARRDNPKCNTSAFNITRDIFEVANNPDVDILVELIGGTTVAKDLILTAIANGKHIVTANKALIAHHGDEIFAAAKAKNVTVAFEAAVAGGIPIIKTIREGLAANNIEWLAGIINGTTNFILTEMRDQARTFDDVLKEAQELGYAEADPTFDVEGIDASHKLVILASLAFGIPLDVKKVFTEGITKISIEDINYAEELGYRIKHLGIARQTDAGIEMRVHPTLVPEKRLLANVDGVMNAVVVKGDAVGPTLYYGAGAGGDPTGSSIVGDIVDVARTLLVAPEYRVPNLGFQDKYIVAQNHVAIDEVETANYLRMAVEDKPGVLSQIANVLSDSGISVEAMIQKETKDGESTVSLILLTDIVPEKKLTTAIAQIESLESIRGVVQRIRVESLK